MNGAKAGNRRKVIVLTLTHQCNLRCSYCYEPVKANRRMPLEMAREVIADELDARDDYDEVEIDFHGGEPFLAFETLKAACEWTWTRRWRRPYVFFATTNGTLVRDKIKEWLSSHRRQFWCCLSIDGTPTMHNVNRPHSFESIDVDFFKDNWPEQPMKMTISPQTLRSLPEGVRYLHSRGLRFTCNLACGPQWTPDDARRLGEQLRELVLYYSENPDVDPCDLLRVPIEYARIGNVTPPKTVPRWCGCGHSMKAYDVDGHAYPCHSTIPFESDASDLGVPLGGLNPVGSLPEDCRSCRFVQICRTCYAANYQASGDPCRRARMDCWSTQLSANATAQLSGLLFAQDKLPARMARWPAWKISQHISAAAALLDQASSVKATDDLAS
ncbi:MAG: radical SAM protein [Vicinamibacterales bacterium]